jgi:hypothetical protein
MNDEEPSATARRLWRSTTGNNESKLTNFWNQYCALTPDFESTCSLWRAKSFCNTIGTKLQSVSQDVDCSPGRKAEMLDNWWWSGRWESNPRHTAWEVVFDLEKHEVFPFLAFFWHPVAMLSYAKELYF